MAALTDVMVAARLQLGRSSAEVSDITVKVVGPSVNGSTDFMDTCGSFVALGRSINRGSAPIPAGLRVAVDRACTLLSEESTHDDNSKLIVRSLAGCIMDDDNNLVVGEIWTAWTGELIELYPPLEDSPPPSPAVATADSPEAALRCTAITHTALPDDMELKATIPFAGRSAHAVQQAGARPAHLGALRPAGVGVRQRRVQIRGRPASRAGLLAPG